MSRGNTEAKVRSVIDLGDEEDIRRALLTATAQTPKPEGERGGGDDNTSLSSLTATITNYGAGSMGISRSSSLSSLNFGGSKEDGVRQTPPSVETLEWYIPCHDTSTSVVQTVDQEVKRLQCLRSYLPMEQSPAMHRLTSIAASTFGNCPISAITLIDLSHSALKGMHGLPLDTPATPRRLTFCSHTVISTLDCLVVLDTHKDARFKNHTFVTGPPYLRFYAGAPLISPEGYRLGTVCVMDMNPRESVSQGQLEILKDLAASAVEHMVAQRNHRETQKQLQLLQHTMTTVTHDLLTPLSGMQMQLSLLHDDSTGTGQRVCSADQQKEMLSSVFQCSNAMERVCQQLNICKQKEGGSVAGSTSSVATKKRVTLPDILDNLNTVIDPLPRSVPIIIQYDNSSILPFFPEREDVHIKDELSVFRAALNLVTNAATRCSKGHIRLGVFFSPAEDRPRRKDANGEDNDYYDLIFECEDTDDSKLISEQGDEVEHLFKEECVSGDDYSRLCLSSIAHTVSNIDGSYGFYARATSSSEKLDVPSLSSSGLASVFWFSVPFVLTSEDGEDGVPVLQQLADKPIEKNASGGYFKEPLRTTPPHQKLKSCKTSQPPSVLTTTATMSSEHNSLCDQSNLSTSDSAKVVSLLSDPNKVTVPVVEFPPCLSKKREVGDIGLQGPFEQRSLKRTWEDSENSVSTDFTCLIATDKTHTVSEVVARLEAENWTVTVAHDGGSLLNRLQARTYDILLVDHDLPGLSAASTLSIFRKWEATNRVNHQGNAYLMMDLGFDITREVDGHVPVIKPPMGFDGVLTQKPVKWDHLATLIGRKFSRLPERPVDKRIFMAPAATHHSS